MSRRSRAAASRIAVAVIAATNVAVTHIAADDWRPVPLQARLTQVQPQTGIVLWADNAAAADAPIQLEFRYLTYAEVVTGPGRYDWSPVERLLDEIAGRRHQAILRWHDTYVGKPTGVPDYIKQLPDYRETTALSEGKPTGFPDWSHPRWRACVLDFYTEFASRYDRDPRIAFVQTGFGLWSEYHIYDGPMELGRTFPSLEFQAEFARHLAGVFHHTPWMISVDAAGEHTPFAGDPELLALPFGVFDDSFNHAKHARENEPNWNAFDRQRWRRAPAGGEFSFFQKVDQRLALAPQGPHGVPFDDHARAFHISFIIGDDQPRFQPAERIKSAGLACGYRFRVTAFEATAAASRVTITNTGIAPIYHDAWPAVGGVRCAESLRGLLPGATRTFNIPAGGDAPVLSIESDRLVPGQRIEFEADLP